LVSQKVRMPQKKTITLEKSLDILELFSKGGNPLSIKELCSQNKLPESTVYRHISTLAKRDYIQYDPSIQKYRLGLNLIKLGHMAAKQLQIHRSSYASMKDLAGKTGETVTLTVKRENNAIVVEVVDSGRGGIKLEISLGDSLPLYLCAITRPLLAFLPEEEIESILHRDPPRFFTSYTVIDLVKIRSELRKIKHLGYSYSAQQLTKGAAGLGAPIRDFSGEVVGGLGLVGPLSNFEKLRIPSLVKNLLEATKQCSIGMGFNHLKDG
jgi:DNA-binding IclR family transcriptional regulator